MNNKSGGDGGLAESCITKHLNSVSWLQSNVEDRLPAVLKLEEESRSLREFHVLDIEVPGQYFNDQVC